MTVDQDIYAKLGKDLGEEGFERLMFESAAAGILKILGVARVRCMTFGELVASLGDIEKIEDASLIIDRFCELDLDTEEQSVLVPPLKSLAERAEILQSKEKARIEGTSGGYSGNWGLRTPQKSPGVSSRIRGELVGRSPSMCLVASA